jgi:hypothetical protein
MDVILDLWQESVCEHSFKNISREERCSDGRVEKAA